MRKVIVLLVLLGVIYSCTQNKDDKGKVVDKSTPIETPLTEGKVIYNKWCASCHNPGLYFPGTAALEARFQGTVPAALEERHGMTPDFIKYYVRNGISVMPNFRKTEISDEELELLSEYLSKQEI